MECSICGFVYKTHRGLKNHMVKKHELSEAKLSQRVREAREFFSTATVSHTRKLLEKIEQDLEAFGL